MQVAQGSDSAAAPDWHEMQPADQSSEIVSSIVLTAWALQMVDRLDQGAIPMQVVAQSYDALWKLVSKALYRTHVEGKLKARPPRIERRAFSLFCHSRYKAGPLPGTAGRLTESPWPFCHCEGSEAVCVGG